MIVGVGRVSLYFPESGSLKGKRHGLRKIIDRTRAKFNVAVAEVGEQQTWQRSMLALAVVGNETRHVQSMLDTILHFIEELYVAQVLDCRTEILTYGQQDPML